MTDRDRLIELIRKQRKFCNNKNCGSCGYAKFGGYPDCQDKMLAHNLIENGVIVPPCKVGDIVYAKYSGTNEIEYYIVDEVIHLGSDNFEFKAHLENEDGYIVDNIDFGVPEIGLTVFLTKEEAEKVLGRSKG